MKQLWRTGVGLQMGQMYVHGYRGRTAGAYVRGVRFMVERRRPAYHAVGGKVKTPACLAVAPSRSSVVATRYSVRRSRLSRGK